MNLEVYIPFLITWLNLKYCQTEELNLNFQQNDYQLKFERVELVRYNKHLIKDLTIVTYKYNRTLAVVNLTLTSKIDLGDEMVILIQVYKFMSNEYRFFPIHFAANACKGVAANILGIKTGLQKCGNFTDCPYKKGVTYHVCNYYPDQSKLPPFIPDGQYKVDIQLMHASQELAVASLYVTVYRPIKYLK